MPAYSLGISVTCPARRDGPSRPRGAREANHDWPCRGRVCKAPGRAAWGDGHRGSQCGCSGTGPCIATGNREGFPHCNPATSPPPGIQGHLGKQLPARSLRKIRVPVGRPQEKTPLSPARLAPPTENSHPRFPTPPSGHL